MTTNDLGDAPSGPGLSVASFALHFYPYLKGKPMIAYALATMWAIGLAGMTFFFVKDVAETPAGKIVCTLVAVPCWAFIGLGPLAFIQHEEGPKLATLLKSEWRCGSSHTETRTTYALVGKVMVPSTSSHQVCDAYIRGQTE